ncbi:hypothetical protein EV200_102673 [Pedobacter psychrotolerans]|uniref:Uncharacterized protein n=1 Tax=Pedobacter psychrotolerans TaxID=1843235 RepID=A0A4V2S022_9SPHI|nr:hypothetical protein EV200_102673 [Pedobacter psychrotolerans]
MPKSKTAGNEYRPFSLNKKPIIYLIVNLECLVRYRLINNYAISKGYFYS